ncbi:MAG: hypothetical protein LQ339_008217 [Xanthoria mediterranea]|nr:MAG: hypothetical protein LQ339_008217 [Xanthoria mediterranea]
MDTMDLHVSVPEEDTPVVIAPEETEVEDSDIESVADQVLASEDQWDDSDKASVATAESEEEEEEEVIEPFEDYKPKIEQLLLSIGFCDFDIEALQHDLHFSNCVYALTSLTKPEEKYILRVPVCPDLREDDGVCEAIINDAALLGHLADQLPVPRVVAYSATKDNVLGEPYTLQTCLPGERLNNIFEKLDHEGKLTVIDQYVELIAKLEAITLPSAGTFAASALEPNSTNEYCPLAAPEIEFFCKGDEEFILDPTTEANRAGPDMKALLASHIDGWIEKERKHCEECHEESIEIPLYEKMKGILEALDTDGTFHQPQSIVLHHWDLEPRNVMVTPTSEGYKITGIIDWDDALALPRTLARRAPDWIWDFEKEGFTGYMDTDFHPKADSDLSQDNLALKHHFDEKAKVVLGDQYLHDAYGSGRLLRRIWTIVRDPFSMWTYTLAMEMMKEWEESQAKPAPVLDESHMAEQQVAEPAMVTDASPVSEDELAESVEASEPQKPVGLWAKVVHCFRCWFRKMKAGL